jgi:hypothetical protein
MFPLRSFLRVKGTVGEVPLSELGVELLDTEPAFITHIARSRCIAVPTQCIEWSSSQRTSQLPSALS